MPALELIHGGGDIVDTLEAMLERARRGELDGVIIATVAGSVQAWSWAHKPEMPHAWARMLAAVAAVPHDMMERGL